MAELYYSKGEVLFTKMLRQAEDTVLDEIKHGKVLRHPGPEHFDRAGIWLYDANHKTQGGVGEIFFVGRIIDLAGGRLAASKLDTHSPEGIKAHEEAAALIAELQKKSGDITVKALSRPLSVQDMPEPLTSVFPQINSMMKNVQKAHIADRKMEEVHRNHHEQATNDIATKSARVTPNAPPPKGSTPPHGMFEAVPPGRFNKPSAPQSTPNAPGLLPPPPKSNGDDVTVREHPTLPQKVFRDGEHLLYGPRSKPLKDERYYHAVPKAQEKKPPATLGAPDDDEKGPVATKPGKEHTSLDPREVDHSIAFAPPSNLPLPAKAPKVPGKPSGNSLV